MQIVIDTREQEGLSFEMFTGIETIRKGLEVGDYSALHNGQLDTVRFERKSVGDLFSSFTSNYDAERNKIQKARDLGLTYILAIEAPAMQIRKGHSYRSNGVMVESKKSGLAMIRQLMTIQRKYQVAVWFCQSRYEMSFMIGEYLLARDRVAG